VDAAEAVDAALPRSAADAGDGGVPDAGPGDLGPVDAAPADAGKPDGADAVDPIVGKPCKGSGDCGPAKGPCLAWQCTGGCYPLYVKGACDDGSACTVGDTCLGGACQPGAAVVCDDNNPCSADICAALTGCQHTKVAEGTPCDAAKVCTKGLCTGGMSTAVVAIAAAGDQSCGIAVGGQVMCWGDNGGGQAGTGKISSGGLPKPQVVAGVGGASGLDCGGNHCCAVTSTGLWCWGYDAYGQTTGTGLNGPPVATAKQVAVPAVEVATGLYHTCARDTGGTVRCWGLGSSGQLGDGSAPVASPPVVVDLAPAAVDLDCGDHHCCAAGTDGQAWCWGFNNGGELGIGVTGQGKQENKPVAAKGVAGVTAVAVGAGHACALVGGGKVMCWGANGSLQTGLSGPAMMATPGIIPGFTGATSLFAGGAHTCALGAGKAWCWGDNGKGQAAPTLTAIFVGAPAEVSGIAGIGLVALGGAHTCVRAGNGGVYCWGANNLGQLGDGSTKDSKIPALVQ